MMARKVNRRKHAEDLEHSLKSIERRLYRLTDEAQAGQLPDAVTQAVLDAWVAVLHAKQASSRVSVDLLLGYSDDAMEKRLDIFCDGMKHTRMLDDIHADMGRVPKDYQGG